MYICVCIPFERIMDDLIGLMEWILSKCYTLPGFIFRFCVCVCFFCLFARTYFIVGLWAVE
jgi:hypothetical protein